MTLTELRGLVGRLSYKPGWTMRAGEDFYCGPMVEIRAEVPDTYSPDRMISICAFARLPLLEYLTEDLALTAIGHALKEAEIHESREWFKLDGKIIDDPHAADRAVA